MQSILFLLTLIVSEISAQFYLKKGTISNTKSSNLSISSFFNMQTIIGIILYALVGALFGLSLNYFKFGLININWQIAMFLTTLGIGFFYFGERYSTQEYIAAILGLISLILLMTAKNTTKNL
tara:strand:+ start:235 stop:603 length:369 start_codon:yes stop_codon:yes gene_type:complete